MATKIVSADGVYDLSAVNNLKELKEEILFLKESVKTQEKELANGLKKLPQFAVKSAADSLLPSFLNKMIANRSWKLLLSGASMFANPFSNKISFTKNILGSAKKLGVMALLKGAYSAWSSKRSSSPKPVIDKTRLNVTSLKTKNFKRN